MSGSNFDYNKVSGDYQFRAMRQGLCLQRFWHRNKLQALDHLFEIDRDDCVVEVGCGSGNLILHTSSQVAKAIGIDISHSALLFCQQRARNERLLDIYFVRALGEALSLPTGIVDKVILVEVIEHLRSPQALLEDLYRVLRPGGQIFITTPNYDSLWPVLEWAIDLLGLTPKMVNKQHISRFTPQRLVAIMQETKFQLIKTGTFYTLSPLMAFFSSVIADNWVIYELRNASKWGMLLYCVAKKPG